MSERTVAFYVALSHTAWGWVPFLCAIGLGVAAYYMERRWRYHRERPVLLALIATWFLLLSSLWFCLAGLFHVGCAMEVPRETSCRSNLRQLGTAMQMYLQDYDDTFPPAERWEAVLKLYVGTPRICPAVKRGSGYGMNKALSGRKLDDVETPRKTVVIFETDALGPSFVGSVADVAQQRHSGRPSVVFADCSTPTSLTPHPKEFVWDVPKPTKKASLR